MPSKWQQAIGAVLAILFAALVPLSTAFADSFPYFTTQNGGPFAGGWFNSGTSSCAGANYQAPTYPLSGNSQYRGAIMGWANLSTRPGASSDLDAFALGLIEGPDATNPNYGFYTGLPSLGPSPTGSRSLSFANINSLNAGRFWGGIFEGAALNAHCIPDYFGTKQTAVSGGWTAGNYSTSGQFTWPGGNLPGGTVAAGTTLIIFVNGNVHITGNINYAAHNITNVPKLALVVRGNIYINPAVTQLNGWYIAQPNPTNVAGTGVIWTCNNGVSSITDTFIRSSCGNALTINGAFTAKQVNLARIAGDLGGATAETVNFSPEMVLGGPFFEDTTTGTTGAIQSLISLPPVF